ncbi:methyl-accepting chemotaxis protein [Blastococcus sp. MG754426]|uniref:MCP four helix bundle domain-containing protein n=1 Tax=Blastococcus sp. MG754426 TaxID=2570317 RepID=UPI001F353EC5|nr:methyl-accepting chemotaxis protein [Blastococcus sp. MG754426]
MALSARRATGGMSVSGKILSSVSLAVLAGVAVGAVGAVSLGDAAGKADASYRESTQALVQVEEMRAQLLTLQLNQTALLLPNVSPENSRTWAEGAVAAGEAFSAAGAGYLRTAPTAAQEGLAQEALGTYDAWSEVYAQTRAAYSAGDAAAAGTLYAQSAQLMDQLTGEIAQLLDSEIVEAKAAAEDVSATNDQGRTLLVVLLAIGSAIALTVGWLVARSIRRNLQKVQHVVQGLAEGDLTRETGIRQSDEIGAMATALDAAQESLRTVMASVVASADAVAASSEELSASSAEISLSAQETSAQSGVVAGAADEVSRNVQTVAAGAEQMGASIREIASNAAEASEVAARAVTAAETTTATVAKLGESSAEIVAQISDRQTTIASAVEEQTATTNEMSRSVQEAADGAGQIAANIANVSGAADSTTQSLTQTRQAVDELSRMAADLRTTVGRFSY